MNNIIDLDDKETYYATNDVMELIRTSIQNILESRLYGSILTEVEGEGIKVSVLNYGFKFKYTLYDVYWASYYGVSAETLANQFIVCYNKYIQKRFFK